jgi:lipopolysaccharide export system permease protein
MYQLAKEKIDRGIKEKRFTEALGEVVVYVDKSEPNGRWHGVYVSDMRGREQPVLIMARSGRMEADIVRMAVTIILENGTLHSTSGLDSQTVLFRRYRLQIPLKPPTRIDGDDVTKLSRGSMSQAQLIEAAVRKGGTSHRGGIVYLTEYHHRLALPVGCLILSLLGVPLGLQAGPGRRATGFPLGLACFVLYYILSSITRVMVEDQGLPLLLGMWLPNLLFAGLCVVVFRRVGKEFPLIPEGISNAATLAAQRLSAPLRHLYTRLIGQGKKIGQGKGTSETMLVHAEPDSGLFHLPGCRMYRTRRASLEFRDIAVAQHSGFRPCPRCVAAVQKYT